MQSKVLAEVAFSTANVHHLNLGTIIQQQIKKNVGRIIGQGRHRLEILVGE